MVTSTLLRDCIAIAESGVTAGATLSSLLSLLFGGLPPTVVMPLVFERVESLELSVAAVTPLSTFRSWSSFQCSSPMISTSANPSVLAAAVVATRSSSSWLMPSVFFSGDCRSCFATADGASPLTSGGPSPDDSSVVSVAGVVSARDTSPMVSDPLPPFSVALVPFLDPDGFCMVVPWTGIEVIGIEVVKVEAPPSVEITPGRVTVISGSGVVASNAVVLAGGIMSRVTLLSGLSPVISSPTSPLFGFVSKMSLLTLFFTTRISPPEKLRTS